MVLRQQGQEVVLSGRHNKGLKKTEVEWTVKEMPGVGDRVEKGWMGLGDWLKGS